MLGWAPWELPVGGGGDNEGPAMLRTAGRKDGRKEGIPVPTATLREQVAVPTDLFCPAVADTYAVHYGHLPIQCLLLSPELLLHLASFLDCLGDSIVVI